MPESRVYPFSCQSAQCGRLDCPADCPNLPTLTEFKEWRERTDAKRLDYVWCPSVWTATRRSA